MDAPRCKLCGEQHYGLCPTPGRSKNVKPNKAKKAAPKKSAQPVSETVELEREEYESLRRDAALWRHHRNKRRHYMRSRRAK